MTTDDTMSGDFLDFAPETVQDDQPTALWNVLVVDDESEVHRVTRLALSDATIDGRGFAIITASSAAEARRILMERRDIAVILLDVVMESDSAGLDLVGEIREVIGNRLVRIILRTGQPGMAPERSVITKYDINDYKSKGELTATRLFTAVVTAARSYRDLIKIEQSRRGLERVINASSSLFEMRAMSDFLSGSLQQLTAILEAEGDAILCVRGLLATGTESAIDLIEAAIGRFEPLIGHPFASLTEDHVRTALNEAFESQRTSFLSQRIAVFFQTRGGLSSAAYVELNRELTDLDRQLAELFCSKAAMALDNLLLFEQLAASQEATVFAMAKLAEFKDLTTGGHLNRVRLLARRIAEELIATGEFAAELDTATSEKLGMASILHDVGKVGVPDAILMKPGKLDDAEWQVMRDHSELGGKMLESVSHSVKGRSFLSIGAEIARAHHEKFDGTGYPEGLAGSAIPLSARIVAVADVFDALMSRRPHKEGWALGDAVAFIAEHSGRHFDPKVVTAFNAAMRDAAFVASLQHDYERSAIHA